MTINQHVLNSAKSLQEIASIKVGFLEMDASFSRFETKN